MFPKELLAGISITDIERIIQTEHSDPHSVLGAHPVQINRQTGVILRLFHPDAISAEVLIGEETCLLYTSPSPRDRTRSRMPSSA